MYEAGIDRVSRAKHDMPSNIAGTPGNPASRTIQ